jgi:hypothetical protein
LLKSEDSIQILIPAVSGFLPRTEDIRDIVNKSIDENMMTVYSEIDIDTYSITIELSNNEL